MQLPGVAPASPSGLHFDGEQLGEDARACSRMPGVVGPLPACAALRCRCTLPAVSAVRPLPGQSPSEHPLNTTTSLQDLSAWTHRQLQQWCRNQHLNAGGGSTELRERMRGALSVGTLLAVYYRAHNRWFTGRVAQQLQEE